MFPLVICTKEMCGLFLYHFIQKFKPRMIKNKIFKQGIEITEKSQETKRDRWGGNVNHKSLFWLH